jgi:hypothetical protein
MGAYAIMGRRNTPSDIWRYVAIADSAMCWLWEGYVSKHNGYAQACWGGATVRAHRLVYSLFWGVTLTPEQYLLHSCDVRHCCNPWHMRIGTHLENMEDMRLRQRAHTPTRTKLAEAGNTTVSPKAARRRITRLGWSEQEAFNTPLLQTGVARGQNQFKG